MARKGTAVLTWETPQQTDAQKGAPPPVNVCAPPKRELSDEDYLKTTYSRKGGLRMTLQYAREQVEKELKIVLADNFNRLIMKTDDPRLRLKVSDFEAKEVEVVMKSGESKKCLQCTSCDIKCKLTDESMSPEILEVAIARANRAAAESAHPYTKKQLFDQVLTEYTTLLWDWCVEFASHRALADAYMTVRRLEESSMDPKKVAITDRAIVGVVDATEEFLGGSAPQPGKAEA